MDKRSSQENIIHRGDCDCDSFNENDNKHCEVLVSCSDWVDKIDLIDLHACDMLSKAVISTACQLKAVIRTACNL